MFNEAAYSFDIPENAPRGYQVGMITATDPDLGVNSQLSYTVISDWANDVFSLNSQTGVFTLTARLDYEEVSYKWFFERSTCFILQHDATVVSYLPTYFKKMNEMRRAVLNSLNDSMSHLKSPINCTMMRKVIVCSLEIKDCRA